MSFFIIEDQDLIRQALRAVLRPYGAVYSFSSPRDLTQNDFRLAQKADLLLIDLDLDYELQGLDFLTELKDCAGLKVILTGRDEPTVIQKAYEKGADDYLVKPFEKKDLLELIEKSQLKNQRLSSEDQAFLESFGFNTSQKEMFEKSLHAKLPLVLEGETGTGKTTLAKFWHEKSILKSGPFISLNCAAFSQGLLESELFGHAKGSFTGAAREHKGKLELADAGVLFLDEVHTMSQDLQSRLLKAIEEKSFYSVGGEKKIESDFFVVSAGSQDLLSLVEKGEFRKDLYYRLKGFDLRLLSLKENKKRLEHFLQNFMHEGKRRRVFTEAAYSCLLRYSWPGNLREFSKELERLRLQGKNCIDIKDISSEIQNEKQVESGVKSVTVEWDELESLGLKSYLAKIENDLVCRALDLNKGKVRQTLKQLKISSHSFYRAIGKV